MTYDIHKERLDEVANRLKSLSKEITRSLDAFNPPSPRWLGRKMLRMHILAKGYRMMANEQLRMS